MYIIDMFMIKKNSIIIIIILNRPFLIKLMDISRKLLFNYPTPLLLNSTTILYYYILLLLNFFK